LSVQELAVGSLSAVLGQKIFGTQTVTAGGQEVTLSFFLIHGDVPGPTLVVTGGVHAAEYASIAAALELAVPCNRRDYMVR